MSGDARHTLFLPFEQGGVPWPQENYHGVFAGARAVPSVTRLPNVTYLQYFKPYADELGVKYNQWPKSFDYALCLLPKNVIEAKGMMAQAVTGLAEGGLIICAADNTAGGNRIMGWFQELGLAPASLSKHKVRAVWAYKTNTHTDVLNEWLADSSVKPIPINGEEYLSCAGLFSWDRADIGSALLAQCLPNDVLGVGADFGCGYGWLARQTINKNPLIQKLYVLDADQRAVNTSYINCHPEQREGSVLDSSALPQNDKVVGIWCDLTKPVPHLSPLDFIVMNPPFHAGKKMDVAIGTAFIQTAADHLKKGGVLWLVANRHLPYEAILTTQFVSVIQVTEQQGFKIFKAIK
jgi:16S rRNA (guanine1207-N2)-methyltransferase